jgi:hypothetical protein
VKIKKIILYECSESHKVWKSITTTEFIHPIGGGCARVRIQDFILYECSGSHKVWKNKILWRKLDNLLEYWRIYIFSICNSSKLINCSLDMSIYSMNIMCGPLFFFFFSFFFLGYGEKKIQQVWVLPMTSFFSYFFLWYGGKRNSRRVMLGDPRPLFSTHTRFLWSLKQAQGPREEGLLLLPSQFFLLAWILWIW